MPPPAQKQGDKEAMVIFSLPGQLGAVGTAFMCEAAEQASGFVDAATMEDMEDLIDKEEVKKGIISGKYRPCTEEDVARLFPAPDNKKK